MIGLIFHPLKNKTLSCLSRKFISSAALIEFPSTEYGQNHSSKLYPLELHSEAINLRGLTLKHTKIIHAILFKTCVLQSNIVAANNLLDAYSECSRMKYAFQLFEEIPEPNLVTWNLMISGCNKNSLYDDSWRIFCEMYRQRVGIDEFTYGSVLSACSALECVPHGQQIYGLVIKNGFFSNGYVRARMIDLFSKSHRIDDALRVLYDVQCENVVCWNAVVTGAIKNKENWIALEIFKRMCSHGSLIPNSFTFSSALSACAALEELNCGKSIQGRVIKCGAGDDVFVGTATVDLYAKCGDMCNAIKQFKLLLVRNVVSWTIIISGYAHKGDLSSAVLVLNEMRKTGVDMNHYTVSSLLAACAINGMLNEAMQIHCLILKIGFCSNSVVKASLITLYAKVGAISSSEVAFSETNDLKQVGVWNTMISTYAKNNAYEKSIIIFKRMIEQGIAPDQFSTSSILSIIDDLTLGRQLHVYALKAGMVSDVFVGSSILTMYSKCGELEESLKSFEQLETKDNITWTSMIAGFVEHGCADKAIQMFRDMFQEYRIDEMSLAAVLMACSALETIKLGREIHGYSIRCGFDEQSISDALVNMYSKCGDLNSARIVFHIIPSKDQVSYSSLISGFSKRGLIEEALQLFHDMLLLGMNTNEFTFSSILGGLASFNKSAIGVQLHAHIIKLGLESESSVASSLIMMYSKQGNIDHFSKVFKQIKNPDLVSLTAMIASYAQHGKGSEAIELYNVMKKSGLEPDSITFVSILSACCHSGLVEEGYSYFNSMVKEYGIEPNHKHYTCMVDLIGRAGRLEEAKRFIMNMHMEPDILIWETLLACCTLHGNHEIGKLASEKIKKLQPSDAGTYISLSNICAVEGEWDTVLKIRESLMKNGMKKKVPGWSLI